MAPDRSRSSTLGSFRAPPGSPGAVLTGAGSVCMLTTLLPTWSASQRKHVSDFLAMVGANTETVHVSCGSSLDRRAGRLAERSSIWVDLESCVA